MIGRLVDGRYQVRSRIARGGMATVYLATDLRLERRVAIKIMHGHLADDTVFRDRFVQEARSAARLAHPNVVNVFDQGQDSDMAYLVMEYLPGVTLRDLLKDYGKLTTRQTVDVMDAVLGGLAAAHKAGIVHRDLKPENVLLADDGRIKIGDFGLARAVSANTATGQALLGTIAYLSPELLTRGVADARSDIYAAGIMMYEMLVGEQPFVGEQPMQIAFQHANDPMPRPSLKNTEVPESLDDLVLWSTAKNPDERPSDAREMLERLRTGETALVGARASQTSTQRTMVLPAEPFDSFDAELDHAQTQVLEERRRTDPVFGGQQPPPPEKALVRKATARRRRGFWIFAAVIVIAAMLGGGGWYYSAGPGAMTTIPDVAGLAPDAANANLQAAGFLPTTTQMNSPTVAAGTVIDTEPSGGTSVRSGSAISLLVSSGPAMLPVPTLTGIDEGTAKAALQGAKFTYASSTQQFSSSAAKGIVLAALGADGNPLGATYGEQQPVTLVVSAGPIPNVAGQTPDQAKTTLSAVGLVGVDGSQDFNDTVPAGQVYQATPTTDPVKPGDSITLDVSRGPELFTIPDVTKMTRDDAKAALTAAGFVPVYSGFWDGIPNALTSVQSMSPGGNTQAPKGTNVNLAITAFG
jgi:serine/threonine-protein kinase